jgi:hypothetical protein
MKNLEDKIWDYIDGLATRQERIDLEALLKQNPDAQEKFDEINALSLDFKDLALDEPSMSFSANIMREINVPLSKSASIDKRIIYAIGGLFGITMAACVLVVLFNIDWSTGSGFNYEIKFPKVSLSDSILTFTEKYQYLFYGFLMFDLAVLLKFIDGYLNKQKENY